MNRRSIIIITAVTAIAGFAGTAFVYDRQNRESQIRAAASVSSRFVRPHSPIIGPVNAPVTIVEFFDPSCESCRAFHPAVKQILARYPKEVRLVIRYTPFHKGSDEAVRILETARLQNLFMPVLDALLDTQPVWARHGNPDLSHAWKVAGTAGLDLERARRDAWRPEIDDVLRQDVADVRDANVRGTPTFFVNDKPLPSFGIQQLNELVRTEVEVARARK